MYMFHGEAFSVMGEIESIWVSDAGERMVTIRCFGFLFQTPLDTLTVEVA